MVEAQEWLDRNYPESQRDIIKTLLIERKNLEGSLDLNDFAELEYLNCSNNQLTKLKVDCLNNLKKLWINDNLFSGSLESLALAKLEKLEWLDISNTDLNSGVEYLPESLSGKYKILYSTDQRSDSKVREIKKHLDTFSDRDWQKCGFVWKEVREWTKIGLKIDEYNFANYLKNGKNLTPEEAKDNLEELSKEYFHFSTWLGWNYPLEQRTSIKELNISNKKLWGDCDLKKFTSLEKLDCSNNYLTELDIGNSLKLKELFCQDNQLEDIIFPIDAEKLVLERVNVTNNKELKYAEIERRFLKTLPILAKNEVKVIDRQELEQMIRTRANIKGEIKDIHFFSAWWNPNCALVVNKVVWYGVRLVVCEPLTEDKENQKKGLEIQLETSCKELVAKESKVTNLQEELATLKKSNQEYEKNNKHLSDELKELKNKLSKLEKERTEQNQALEDQERENRKKQKRLERKAKGVESKKQDLAKIKDENEEEGQITTEKLNREKAEIQWELDEQKRQEKEQEDKKYSLLKETEEEISWVKEKIQENSIEKNNKEEENREKELVALNQQINTNQQKINELKTEIQKIKMARVFKVIKISEHIRQDKTDKDVEELKEKLNSHNPILTLSNNSGFSVNKVMQMTSIKREKLKRTEQEPDQYLKPADIVWRTMKGMPGCYHVAVYLGNNRVVHIGSSKFVKTSKIKDSKSLLGARTDNWKDFLHDTDKLIRYHLLVPFQRPEKIQEHIIKAVLAEHGAESYSFLGNNCEHFATLVVCGIPFSTQVDKFGLLFSSVYLDLAKEMVKSEKEFAKMSDSETFAREFERNKEHRLNEIKELKDKDELNEEEQQGLANLEKELQELEELQTKSNLSGTSSEIDSNTFSCYGNITSLISNSSNISQSDWEQTVKKKTNIQGTIEQIIPLETNPNQVLVINKVVLYAVRLFEYNPQLDQLTELKRYAKNKVGYTSLADALVKLERIKETEINQWKDINQGFTEELIIQWTNHSFTPNQVRDWINIGLRTTDANFAVWLRNIKKVVDVEWMLNHVNQEELRQEFTVYQEQSQAQIEQPPK